MGTNMTVEPQTKGRGQPEPAGAESPGEGSATRRRILRIALTLMSQRGVDGTSMRDLASAAGLNVATLYHYFPSKRDLLEAVLVEQGVLPLQAPMAQLDGVRNSEPSLAELLTDILVSMFEVEDFVRLMIGEAMRGESTARAVGLDLFTSFQDHIEGWIAKNRPDLDERAGAGEVARLLSAMVVGVFILNSAGVISGSVGDVTALSLQRAGEAANILRPPD
jgi:AcrR family transcriptional regulator